MNAKTRLQLARECLRQLWQIFDAGGHSLGRSEESMLLELALTLIESDHQFSDFADRNRLAFQRFARDEVSALIKRRTRKEDARLFGKVYAVRKHT